MQGMLTPSVDEESVLSMLNGSFSPVTILVFRMSHIELLQLQALASWAPSPLDAEEVLSLEQSPEDLEKFRQALESITSTPCESPVAVITMDSLSGMKP